MPDISAHAMDSAVQVARRWTTLDPLLPHQAPLPHGCGTAFTAAASDGPTVAASCAHWQGTPGSLELTWGAARRFRLTAHVPGPDVTHGLDGLLSRWREHLARVPGTDDQDSSAVVTWPSRDADGVKALLRHGLTPLSVLAARVTSRHQADPPTPSTTTRNARIRRASPADAQAVLRLGLETIRYDACFGVVTERPDTAQALHNTAAEALAGPEPWVWLAERDGHPAGMVWVQPPDATGWIAPMTRLTPVAYILLMGISAGHRGHGTGAALAAQAHHTIRAAGIAVTLLHYALPNPLSMPFWSAHGYRPLWTIWETRTASWRQHATR